MKRLLTIVLMITVVAGYSQTKPESCGSDALHLKVFDVLGRILITLPLSNTTGQQTLDVSRYAAGTYLIVLKQDGQVVAKSKLLLNKK